MYRPAPMMRWKPYLGQEEVAPVPTAPVPPPTQQAPSDWPENVKHRLLAFGIGGAIGVGFGLLRSFILPSSRLTRQQAAIGALLTGTLGGALVLAPLGKSGFVDTVTTVSGALAGVSGVNIVFPKKQRS